MTPSKTNPKTDGKPGNSNFFARHEQQVLDIFSAGILITRLTDGTILYANKALARLLGVSDASEVTGNLVSDLYWDAKDRQKVLERFRAEGTVTDYELRARHADGSMKWVSISIRSFDFEGEQVLLSEITDITSRKQMEQEVHESEERFRRFAEATIEGLVFHEKGTIIDANPSALAMFGLSENDKFIGRNLMEFIVPESQQLALQQMQLETVLPYEIQCIRNDGTIFPVETSTRTYKVGDRTIRASSIRDITERKQAEQLVRQSEARFRALFDNAADSIFLMKGPTIVDCNRSTAQVYGATPEQAIGKTPIDFSPEFQPDGQKSAEKAVVYINQALAGQPQVFYWKHKRPDGTLFDAEISLSRVDIGEEVYIQAFTRDITQRMLAEELLRESETRFRSIFDAANDAIFLMEGATIVDCNPRTVEIYGATRDRIIGKTPIDFSPEFQPDGQNSTEKATSMVNLTLAGQPQVFYWKHKRPDGTLFDAEISLNRVDVGKEVYVQALTRDITERMRLEREVREAFERRGYQVQVSTQISQEVATATELNELFERVVTLTKERLGYYHTQLLRYDPVEDAVVLIKGYGETGQKMLESGHRMPMGSGLIGTAAATGETVMRSSLADDIAWQPNPLLPDTKGEIAVPIKWQDNVLGVLDVQSDQAGTLTEDDRLLLEGLCGQIAVAMEQTRLRQEMTERLEEVNRLYQSMSREGWKSYRETETLPTGFVFDQTGVRPIEDVTLADELFASVPMKVLGGEVVGTLAVQNDPRRPITPEDNLFIQQVSEQVALALESARLTAQTQSALAQSETLFQGSARLTQAADLQELVKSVAETMNIPAVNRIDLAILNYDSAGNLESGDLVANWWNGIGSKPNVVGLHYPREALPVISLFITPAPVFFNDTFKDERIDKTSLELIKSLNIRAAAVLPLFAGTRQVGVLIAEAEEPHNFTPEQIRLFTALAPQIATVLENRRQFERARQQAEREGLLNIISQKIQSATTVEDVLQIAARELGHALGAPMTIARLNLKGK